MHIPVSYKEKAHQFIINFTSLCFIQSQISFKALEVIWSPTILPSLSRFLWSSTKIHSFMYPVFKPSTNISVLVSLIFIEPCSCTTITRVWTVMCGHAFKSLVVTILLKRWYGTAVKRRWKCSSEIWEHVDMTASHFLQICQLRSHGANYHLYHSS